jgi:hypothetical protein
MANVESHYDSDWNHINSKEKKNRHVVLSKSEALQS